MSTITNILETFEKLAYKFLLAVLFFPKTIFQIIINPGWAPDYIRGEFKQEKNPFDEYMSPIVLLLLVSLIPALVRNVLPTFETTITAVPAKDEPATTRLLEFQAETDIRFRSPDVFNQYTWTVQKIISKDSKHVAVNLYTETYNEYTNMSLSQFSNEDQPVSMLGTYLSSLEYKEKKLDSPVSKLSFKFDDNSREEGVDEYLVSYEIVSFYPKDVADTDGNKYFPDKVTDVFDADNSQYILERHSASQTIYVPNKNYKNQQIIIPIDAGGKKAQSGGVNVSDLLKKETTTFLALGLLFPPLLFSLAIKLFNRAKKTDEDTSKEQEAQKNKAAGSEITENSLRESFYAQCYYFSPLSLAIWATYYARYFLTPDVFNYKENDYALSLILLPALLALFWFISVETSVIKSERDTKPWIAFLITLFCVVLIVLAGITVFMFVQPDSSLPDAFRTRLIVAYPWIGVALLGLAGYGWARTRWSSEHRHITRDLILIGIVVLVVYGTLRLMGLIMDTLSAPSTQSTMEVVTEVSGPTVLNPLVVDTPSGAAPVETPPTETPAASTAMYYTEEFDGNLDSWTPFTLGDESRVNRRVENGSLRFSLTPADGKVPAAYFYNNVFTYTDVQLDLVTTNNGNNSNSVTLVCRSTKDGWYEFNISNSGVYSIYAVDIAGTVQQGFNELSSGNSSSIKAGLSTNTYTAVCKGSELSLYVNGDFVNTAVDTTYNFGEGNIGIGVSALQDLPVDVSIDSLTVSEP